MSLHTVSSALTQGKPLSLRAHHGHSSHMLHRAAPHSRRACVALPATGGFGGQTDKKPEDAQQTQQQQASTSASTTSVDAAEALEARIRNRRARRSTQDGPRVDVKSAAVEATKGDGPLTPQQQAETNLVTGMLFLFYTIIIEGLVIGGSGFLPEDWDDFIQNVLYPNYTPTVLLFLGISSAYGLWKTGKISLPYLGTPQKEDDAQK